MAIISFTSLMDLSGSTKVFQFTDTSDYIGQGITLADVNGNFKITSPSGAIVHNNTNFADAFCDINRGASANNQTLIQVPIGLDGEPQAGIYTIEYTVLKFSLPSSEVFTVTNTYNVNYTSPVVAIAQTVDCISPLFSSVDVTDYTVGGTAPVIDRTHTINFPFGSAGEGSPVIGVTQTLTTSTFYNGTQTTEIFSELTYTFPDGMMIYDEVSGSKEILVDCTDVCAIYCCIRALEQRMISYSTTNTVLYRETTLLFSQIMGLVGLVTLAQRCGKSDEINGYLSSIKLLANCTDDCACSGDAPVQVVGLCGLVNQVIVQSGGDPIEVEGLTSGGVTTYTIYFSGALLTTINSLYNTEVVAGVNLLSITDVTVGIVKTFTVNGLKTTVSAGDGVTVTPGATVGGVTDYEVAVVPVIKYTKEFENSGDSTTEVITYAEIVAACGSGFINGYLGTGTLAQPKTDFHILLWFFDAEKGVWFRESTATYLVSIQINPTTGDITITFIFPGLETPLLWRAVLIG